MAGEIIYFIASFFGLIAVFTVLNLIILIMVRKNISWQYIILAGLIFSVGVMSVWLLVENKFDPGAAVNSVKKEARVEYEMALKMDGLKELPAAMQDNFKKIMKYLVVYSYPAQILVRLLFIVFLNYFVVRLFVMRQGKQENFFLPFTMWHADERAAWALIISFVMLLAGDKIFHSMPLKIIAVNILLVAWFYYLVVGFSLVGFYMQKFKLKWAVQGIIYLVIFFTKWPMAIMVLTGVIDTWFNFRRLEKGGPSWK